MTPVALSGGVGRITGAVIGTVILGVMTSGFAFLRVDAYYQEIVKGIIIIAAVVADQYRQRKTRKTGRPEHKTTGGRQVPPPREERWI